jgi:hypothetical protein
MLSRQKNQQQNSSLINVSDIVPREEDIEISKHVVDFMIKTLGTTKLWSEKKIQCK